MADVDPARFRAILDEAIAAMDEAGYGFIVAVSRLAGELGLAGEVGVRLRILHDRYCRGELMGAALVDDLRALRELPDDAVIAASDQARVHRLEGAIDVGAVELHLSAPTEAHPPGQPDDLWKALYGPAYLLGWYELVGAERALLRLPLVVADPVDEAALRERAGVAVTRAQLVFPALDVDLDTVDVSSRVAFAWTWSRALHRAAAGFDRAAAPPPPREGSRVPAPDLIAIEQALLTSVVEGLARWAADNPDAELAQLGLDGTPPYGNVGICFDSAASFAVTSVALEASEIADRRRLGYDDWASALRVAGSRAWMTRFDPSEFSDQGHTEVVLDGFERYARSAWVPAPRDGGEPWATAVQRILFVRVIDQLVEGGTLAGVRCAPRVYLSYSFHDEVPVLVREISR